MRRLNIRDARGFTFVDSLFDLLALSIVLPLAALFYLFIAHIMADLDSSATEFQLFSLELQEYFKGSSQVHVMREGKGLRVHRPDAVYDLELHGTVVRKRKGWLGHEIMLTEVRDCTFTFDGKVVGVKIEFLRGLKEESEYAVPFP